MTAYRCWSTLLDGVVTMSSIAYELRERAEADLAAIVARAPMGFTKHEVAEEQIPRMYQTSSGEWIRIASVVIGRDEEWTKLE